MMPNPNLAAFGAATRPTLAQPAQAMPQVLPQLQRPQLPIQAPAQMAAPNQNRMTPQEAASLGRFGDSIVAHLTPGEIAVPPQVQNPKVLTTLNKAFQKSGVNESQFTAGSPKSSVNPQTGMPEYNFLSGLLGPLLGLAGAFVAPELLPFLGSAAGAVGGGLGTALGTKLSGGSTEQALLSGLGSGAGGYLGGQLFPNATVGNLVNGTTGQALSGAGAASETAAENAAQRAAAGEAIPTGSGASSSSLLSGLNNLNYASGIGGALGGSLLGSIASPQPTNTPPNGVTTPAPTADQLPSPQTLLGQPSYRGPSPTFTNFNPYAAALTSQYNYFPTQ